MEFVGIEKLSLVDYDDKVSCILFTERCNFACPFCHNSELVLKQSETYIPFDDIISYLQKRKNTIDAVVISGGEPTLMPDLKEKIIKIRELGFLIKLDTNGSNPKILKDLVNSNLIDYVAMDVKNSFSKYPLTAGKNVDIDSIKESIAFLINGNVDYEFRTTLVDEFHSDDSIEEMAKQIRGAKKIYLQKFVDHGSCIKEGLHAVTEKKAQGFVDILKPYVCESSLRGY